MFLHDLRFAIRQLRQSPLFTLTAILTLSLGIGATTAVFSLIEGILLRAKVPAQTVARIRDQSLKNVTIPGAYLRVDVAAALGMKGVHVNPFVERAYSASRAAR